MNKPKLCFNVNYRSCTTPMNVQKKLFRRMGLIRDVLVLTGSLASQCFYWVNSPEISQRWSDTAVGLISRLPLTAAKCCVAVTTYFHFDPKETVSTVVSIQYKILLSNLNTIPPKWQSKNKILEICANPFKMKNRNNLLTKVFRPITQYFVEEPLAAITAWSLTWIWR